MPRQPREADTSILRKKIFGSLLWFQVAAIDLGGTNAEFFKRFWEYRERIPTHGRYRYKKHLEELIDKCGESILSVTGFNNQAELWATFEQIPSATPIRKNTFWYEPELWLVWLEQIQQELYLRKREFAEIKEKMTNLTQLLLEQARNVTDNR